MVASLRILRRAGLLALGSALIAGAALAHDYVVVASSDPGIAKGLVVDSGQKLALAPGQKLTLMHASGFLVTLKGAPGGVTAPARRSADTDSARMEVLRAMVAPKPKDSSEGLGIRRRRGGVCPPAESLVSVDAIVQAQVAGCSAQASTALDAFIAGQTPDDAN